MPDPLELGKPGVVANRIKAFNDRASKANKEAELHRKQKTPQAREVDSPPSAPAAALPTPSPAATTVTVAPIASSEVPPPQSTAKVTSVSPTSAEPTGSIERSTFQTAQASATPSKGQVWNTLKETEPLIDVVHGFVYQPPGTHPPHLEHLSGVKNTVGRKPCPHHKHAAWESHEPLPSQSEASSVSVVKDVSVIAKDTSSSPFDQPTSSKTIFVRVDANGQPIGSPPLGSRIVVERAGCRTCNHGVINSNLPAASSAALPSVTQNDRLKSDETHYVDQPNADIAKRPIENSTVPLTVVSMASKPNTQSAQEEEANVQHHEQASAQSEARQPVDSKPLATTLELSSEMNTNVHDLEFQNKEGTNTTVHLVSTPDGVRPEARLARDLSVVDVSNLRSASAPDRVSINQASPVPANERPIGMEAEAQTVSTSSPPIQSGSSETLKPPVTIQTSKGLPAKRLDEKISRLMDAFQPSQIFQKLGGNNAAVPVQASPSKQTASEEVVAAEEPHKIPVPEKAEAGTYTVTNSGAQSQERDEAIKDAQDVIDAIVIEHGAALLDVTTRLSQEISQLTIDMRLKEGESVGRSVPGHVPSSTEIIPKLEEQSILLSQLIGLIERSSQDWRRSVKDPLTPVVSDKADSEQRTRATSFPDAPLPMPLPLRRACSTPALPSSSIPDLFPGGSIHTIEVLPIGTPTSKWYVFPLCHVAIRPYKQRSRPRALGGSSKDWEDRSSILDAYLSS